MTTDEWLKDQCGRYLNGRCYAAMCLRRGGHTQGGFTPEDYDRATCHAHETLQELESLRKEKHENTE